jgi:ribosomal protein S18 acetylase RimI-like enzyme
MHGQGLGTILIERLAEIAERRGVRTLVAEVLPENEAMLEVFRDGFDAAIRWTDGVDSVEFPSAAWRLARTRYGG